MFPRYRTLSEPILALSKEQLAAVENFRKKLSEGEYQFEHSACLCGNEDGRLISQVDRYALPVNTYLCRSCGMLWTSPRLNPSSMEKFYRTDYRMIYVGSQLAPDDFFDQQVQHGKQILEFVAPYLEKSNPVVLDVGCGAGGVLIPFARAGARVSGCDVNATYLLRGVAEGLELMTGGVESLKHRAPADLVILSHVLEHIADPIRFMDQVCQLIDDGGYVYLEMPGIYWIHRTYRDTLAFLQNAHLYHYSLSLLNYWMGQAGLQLVKGTEVICALYKKVPNPPPVRLENQYNKVLLYLVFVELRRYLLEKAKLLRKIRVLR